VLISAEIDAVSNCNWMLLLLLLFAVILLQVPR
jgi:hypothetical protein